MRKKTDKQYLQDIAKKAKKHNACEEGYNNLVYFIEKKQYTEAYQILLCYFDWLKDNEILTEKDYLYIWEKAKHIGRCYWHDGKICTIGLINEIGYKIGKWREYYDYGKFRSDSKP